MSVSHTRPWNPDKIKFLSLDEFKRLFSVIETKRDRALFLLAYRHGLRASEVALLQKPDLDFKAMRIMVHRLKDRSQECTRFKLTKRG